MFVNTNAYFDFVNHFIYVKLKKIKDQVLPNTIVELCTHYIHYPVKCQIKFIELETTGCVLWSCMAHSAPWDQSQWEYIDIFYI